MTEKNGYTKSHKAYYERNKKKLYEKAKARLQEDEPRLRRLQYARAYAFRLKVEVLSHYGDRCICCGEDDMRFLSLDHIDGGGNEHRRSLNISGGGGAAMFLRLRKDGYPEGFQVLCYNCNFAKGIYEQCPHAYGIDQMGSLLYQVRGAWATERLPADKKRKQQKEVA